MALDQAQMLENKVIIQFEMWELHTQGLEAEHLFHLPCLSPFLAVKYCQKERENFAIIKKIPCPHQNKTEGIE